MAAVKITFGIQKEMIQRIEELSKHWDDQTTEEEKKVLKQGWIKFDRHFWETLGKEFGWDPFTLALHYFRSRS